jgi:hypothetical protein
LTFLFSAEVGGGGVVCAAASITAVLDWLARYAHSVGRQGILS